MTVNYEYVRRIILNDRLFGYRPDRKAIEELRDRLPDMQIIGFGIWSRAFVTSTWFLLVESKRFWADPSPIIDAIPMRQLPIAPKRLNVVPENLPPKSPA